MNFRRLGTLVGLLGLAITPCRADEGLVPILSFSFVERIGVDLLDLPSTVAHWQTADWATAGGFCAAGLAAYSVDGDVRHDFHNHNPEQAGDLSSAFTHFGSWQYEVPLLGAAWIGGLMGSSELNRVAVNGIEASAIAAGTLVPIMVYVSGRPLPNKNFDADTFHPFHGHEYSFPSGHTSEAFAVASVLDQTFRERFGYWHLPIVYGAATAVGISRIRDQRHFLSDVVIGAGIGWATGRWVSLRHQPQAAAAIAPLSRERLEMLARDSEGDCTPEL
jgi:membrane-associated phospholipid phosphatase